jgi:hypothetical protein
MMTIANIPAEVYLIALDHMGVDRPAETTAACAAYDSATSRVDYATITARQQGREISPITAFGLALAQYVSLSGPFAEDGGEFSGINGFETP